MKILSITAQKPHSTGSGTYMTELVRAFDRMGHSQAAVFGIYPSDNVEFPDGVLCYPVFFTDDSKASPFSADYGAALPFRIAGMSDIMPYPSVRYRDLTTDMITRFEDAFIHAVSHAVADLDPDLIICHHLFLLTALVRKHFPERKVAGISHGSDLRQAASCDHLRELVSPQVAELDMTFALHKEQAERIKNIFGLDDDMVRVIGSGYNAGLFNTKGRIGRKPGDPVRIAYAGKISRAKGVPELLAALMVLSENAACLPRFELTLAGGCPDEELKAELEKQPPYVSWLGQIPQPDLAELLRRTDIFVLPSYYEGLPLVPIEAMACGAVPVITDLPGIRPWIEENVPGHNARFITMPEMKSIDEPSDKGRADFTRELADLLSELIGSINRNDRAAGCGADRFGRQTADCDQNRFDDRAAGCGVPDTSSITWDGAASRILSNFIHLSHLSQSNVLTS